ncbi:MAG: hypothetical protein J6B07_07085, partial [Opitutales bacterium]|nr:hypothetical protein [Opitutales bacterium]
LYKRSKGCHFISPELPDEGEYKTLDSSYSYKNNKNGIVTITITTKDKFTNTTYKGELVLFEFSKDIKGIYTLESTDANKQRSVKVVELLEVISD